jgi:hypothetical protein
MEAVMELKELKKISLLVLYILSSFICLEIGLSRLMAKDYLLSNNNYCDEFADMGVLRSIYNRLQLGNEEIDILREEINVASIDEIIYTINEGIRLNNGLFLSYVLLYISHESMHEIIQRFSDEQILDVLTLVLESDRPWEVRSVLLLLEEEGRRSSIRNAAPDNISARMDEIWMSLNDDNW